LGVEAQSERIKYRLRGRIPNAAKMNRSLH
jgi:hypothetical protein